MKQNACQLTHQYLYLARRALQQCLSRLGCRVQQRRHTSHNNGFNNNCQGSHLTSPLL